MRLRLSVLPLLLLTGPSSAQDQPEKEIPVIASDALSPPSTPSTPLSPSGSAETDFIPTTAIDYAGSARPTDTAAVVAFVEQSAAAGSADSQGASSGTNTATNDIQTRATYEYPQPPLPAVTATRNPNAWTMSPDFEITDVPTTREYTFDIAPATAAPDGYPRQIYAVNNQFPGPLIEANEGDEIVIHMNNHLDIGMAVHWHGMYQNGSAFMDGVPGVSQCPIPPGQSFTYRFTIQNQYGSYWWHSHFANTLADGLVGGLIVHSVRDPVKRGVDFDTEVVVMVQDWMDLQSDSIVQAMHTDEGYRGSPAPPQGDAILINGVGRTNCSNLDIQDHSLPCDPLLPPEIPVPAGQKVRMRILNVGSYGMYRISIDQHPFELVEVDDTAIHGPTGIHEVSVATGQRASIILSTDQGDVGSAYYLRANIVTACIGRGGIPQLGLGILRYVDADGNSPNYDSPDTKAWDDLKGEAAVCADIDEEYDIKPREAVDAPYEVLQTHAMSSSLGKFVDKDGHKIGAFGFNNITYQNQVGYPLLTQVLNGEEIDGKYVAHASFDKMGGGDIIINNLDAGISHPYHLHGKPFMIVARGEGNMNKEQWEGMREYAAKTSNPVRRDVIEIRGGGYAVLRLYIDLPGIWPLHCHIGWHLAEGKLAAFVYLPEEVRKIQPPEEWNGMCAHWGHDEIGPAKRELTGFEADLRDKSKALPAPTAPAHERRLLRGAPRRHRL